MHEILHLRVDLPVLDVETAGKHDAAHLGKRDEMRGKNGVRMCR